MFQKLYFALSEGETIAIKCRLYGAKYKPSTGEGHDFFLCAMVATCFITVGPKSYVFFTKNIFVMLERGQKLVLNS